MIKFIAIKILSASHFLSHRVILPIVYMFQKTFFEIVSYALVITLAIAKVTKNIKSAIFLHLILLLIFLLIFLNSCAKNQIEKTATPAQEYHKGLSLLKKKNYEEAAEVFEKIEDNFPFSAIAIKSHLVAVYCYYQIQEYAKAIAIAESFIPTHPNSDFTPYMIYMKGLSYYQQITNIKRAQDMALQANLSFYELNNRFPYSIYRSDAEEKITVTNEYLAGSKLEIARYQISGKNLVGAITNLQYVVKYFGNSAQVPEAYFRMLEIYRYLDMKKEAKTLEDIIKKDFANSQWAKML
jgi:outer membrane protein assembly factor BamD